MGWIKHGNKVAEQAEFPRGRSVDAQRRIGSCLRLRFSLYRFQGSEQRKIRGGLAQLVERLPCKQEVSGSTPLISTTHGSLAQSVRALA